MVTSDRRVMGDLHSRVPEACERVECDFLARRAGYLVAVLG